jgi:thioesterase domain-containing protein
MSLSERTQWFKRVFDNRLRIWTGKTNSWTLWDQAYRPENFQTPRFRAPIVLFKRPKQPYYYINDPYMGWSARTESGVEIHEINADHHEMLREPHVQVVGGVLAAHIRPESRPSEPAVRDQTAVPSATLAPSH